MCGKIQVLAHCAFGSSLRKGIALARALIAPSGVPNHRALADSACQTPDSETPFNAERPPAGVMRSCFARGQDECVEQALSAWARARWSGSRCGARAPCRNGAAFRPCTPLSIISARTGPIWLTKACMNGNAAPAPGRRGMGTRPVAVFDGETSEGVSPSKTATKPGSSRRWRGGGRMPDRARREPGPARKKRSGGHCASKGDSKLRFCRT